MKIRLLITLLAILLIQLPVDAKKRHRAKGHSHSYAGNRSRKHKTPHSTFVPIQVSTEGEVWGLDISHHQQKIDWETVSQNQPHFVFLKTKKITSAHAFGL